LRCICGLIGRCDEGTPHIDHTSIIMEIGVTDQQ
jgi:hypothetical protein